jgi:mannose-6-phosphate isomerase-like protein (cupin superfamily)
MFETFFVLSGSGVFTINGVAQTVELYDTITLKPGDTHEVENPIDNRVDLRVLYFGVV